MQTFFAPAERLDSLAIKKQVEDIKNNVFLSQIMNSLKSLIAVINLQRQIVAVNHELVRALGFKDMEEVFGLRPGEAIDCVYAKENTGGCGTSKMCQSCGAVKAILNSIEYNNTQVELCAMRIHKDKNILDLAFEVTACPVKLGNETFITLHMRDISKERIKDAMERTFFHDINNLLSALVGSTEILSMQNKRNINLESKIGSLSTRISREIEVQRALAYAGNNSYRPDIKSISIQDIIDEIKVYMELNEFNIKIINNFPDSKKINSDITLVLKILTNMLKNAVEALNNKKELVTLTIDEEINAPLFKVWNSTVIPANIHRRIFQEHFSTKKGSYRGLGTHSMKTFGEDILKGKVWFESIEGKGTTFFLKLPAINERIAS